MDNLFKEKAGYALALLAALFTLTPVVQKIGNFGFVFLNLPITITLGYIICCILLGLAVYFFAVSFITYRLFFISIIIGNLFYLLAVLILPLYIILYLASLLLQKFGIDIKQFLGAIIGGIIGIVLSVIVSYYEKKSIKKDSPLIIKHLKVEQDKNLSEATAMLNKDQYHTVIMSCWRALEISLKKLLITQGVYHIYPSVTNLAGLAYKYKMISKDQSIKLMEIYKQIERTITHHEEHIDKNKAIHIFDEVKALLKEIDCLTDKNSKIAE